MEFASTDGPLLGLALCLPLKHPAARLPGRPPTCRRPPAAHGPPVRRPRVNHGPPAHCPQPAARPSPARLPARPPAPPICPPAQARTHGGGPRAKLSTEKRPRNVWHQVCELCSNLQHEVHQLWFTRKLKSSVRSGHDTRTHRHPFRCLRK